MGSKVLAMIFTCMIYMLMALPPIYACGYCEPHPPYRRPSPPTTPRTRPPSTPQPHPPSTKHPPHHGKGGGSKGSPPSHKPPVVLPPIVMPPPVITPPIINPPVITPPTIMPPITNPPVIIPPPSSSYPPYTSPPPSGGSGGHSGGGGGHGGGGIPGLNPPPTMPTCPVNALKLGLCVDVLGGLVHIGLGDPVENVCCPVLQGLLELEAAICLCTTIRLKLLNLNIFIPLALQVLATCGLTPPPGFVCPPLLN